MDHKFIVRTRETMRVSGAGDGGMFGAVVTLIAMGIARDAL
jgi:hypothetical protein